MGNPLMDDFKFYSTNEVYGETYYQLPKVFFTNKNYINLSNAKLLFQKRIGLNQPNSLYLGKPENES